MKAGFGLRLDVFFLVFGMEVDSVSVASEQIRPRSYIHPDWQALRIMGKRSKVI
jgi:hypothetical protein